jgi:hypothetical protein
MRAMSRRWNGSYESALEGVGWEDTDDGDLLCSDCAAAVEEGEDRGGGEGEMAGPAAKRRAAKQSKSKASKKPSRKKK